MKNIIFILFFTCISCYASAGESRFSSVTEMIEEFSDYSSSNGTYNLSSSELLHIQLSPMVVDGDLPEVIEESIKRTIIYGIYRSFIHTGIEQITVTAIPMEISFKGGKNRYLKGYERTITISRDKAISLIKKHLKISNLSSLVTEITISGMTINDQWSNEFKRIYYNDQGHPGITRFFGDLAK